MKKIYLSVIIATLILVSSTFVSACIVTDRDQVALIFPSDAGINMDVLENYCTDKNCQVSYDDIAPQIYKRITFQTQYEGHEMIFIAQTSQDEETSPEINSLSVKFLDENPEIQELTSLGLRLLIANDIVYGISAQDVSLISDIITTGNLVYFKPSSCGNSYLDGSGSQGDDGESGWLLGAGNCMVETFEDICPQIQCYKCGIGASLTNLNLISLSLANSPIAEYSGSSNVINSDGDSQSSGSSNVITSDGDSQSNYIYYLIAGLAVIVIAIILFLIKKKK